MKTKRLIKRQGFALVEMTIVVCTIIVLAALSIYGLFRAKVFVNDEAAARNTEVVAEAMKSYMFVNSTMTTNFNDLVNATPPYLTSAFSDGNYQGYNFWVIPKTGRDYLVYAQPERYRVTGTKFVVYDNLNLKTYDDYSEAGTYVLAQAEFFPSQPEGWGGDGQEVGDGSFGVALTEPPAQDQPEDTMSDLELDLEIPAQGEPSQEDIADSLREEPRLADASISTTGVEVISGVLQTFTPETDYVITNVDKLQLAEGYRYYVYQNNMHQDLQRLVIRAVPKEGDSTAMTYIFYDPVHGQRTFDDYSLLEEYLKYLKDNSLVGNDKEDWLSNFIYSYLASSK